MRETMKKIGLEEQKQMMLEMLADFDGFCRDHNLTYYLTGGTLLGAVRHHGYIPWDDDIDVGMPRSDYEKFAVLYNKDRKNPDYEFVSYHQIPDLYLSSGKLVDIRTEMEEAVDSKVRLGVYLDIFPLDNLGKTEEEAKRFTEEALKIRRKLDVQNWKIIKERAWYKNLIIRIIKAVSGRNGREKLVREQDAFCSKNMPAGLDGYVGYPCAAMKQELLKGEWFEKTLRVPFESYEFNIPAEYDRVLNVFYGPSYMQLPPEEKRKTHHVYDVWFKD